MKPMTCDWLAALRRCFAGMVEFDDREWARAAPLFARVAWPAGAYVLHAGETASHAYFLIEGRVRDFYTTADGKERIKAIVGPGAPLASMHTWVHGLPSPFSIQTLRPCVAAAIAYPDFAALCEASQPWNVLLRRMLENLALRKERREASFLLLSAQERYEQFLDEFADLADEIPLNQVAMYLGITDVALSRIRKRMGLTQIKGERAAPESTPPN